jgi:hypothetical protein
MRQNELQAGLDEKREKWKKRIERQIKREETGSKREEER